MNQKPGEARAGELPTWRSTSVAVVVGEEGTVQTARGSTYPLARGTRGVFTNICGVNDCARTQCMTSLQPCCLQTLELASRVHRSFTGGRELMKAGGK